MLSFNIKAQNSNFFTGTLSHFRISRRVLSIVLSSKNVFAKFLWNEFPLKLYTIWLVIIQGFNVQEKRTTSRNYFPIVYANVSYSAWSEIGTFDPE